MRTLYHGEPNGPSLSVLAALFETGVEADLHPIDLLGGERHGGAVPRNRETEMSIEGEGPVLVDDGEAMADSVFLGCYLDETAGGGVLLPRDPYQRWDVMRWCRWVIERVAPAAALLGVRANAAAALAAMDGDAFARLAANIASEDLRARWQEARGQSFAPAQVADSQTKIDEAVDRIEKQLAGRDWLLGDFSLADLETYAWIAGMEPIVPLAFTHAPRIRIWMERVRTRPSVARALGLARGGDPRHAWAPGPEINRWG